MSENSDVSLDGFLGVTDITSSRSSSQLNLIDETPDNKIVGMQSRHLVFESYGKRIFDQKVSYNDLVFMANVLTRSISDDFHALRRLENLCLGGGSEFKARLLESLSQITSYAEAAQADLREIEFVGEDEATNNSDPQNGETDAS